MTQSEIDALYVKAAPLICRDLTVLAPGFRRIALAAIADLDRQGVDFIVMETERSDALEAIYYQIGTTHAPSALYSWHGFCLALDGGSKAKGEDAWNDPVWASKVIAAFKSRGCGWGGEWKTIVDRPHWQAPGLKPSPSDEARALYASGGLQAVWAAVGMAA